MRATRVSQLPPASAPLTTDTLFRMYSRFVERFLVHVGVPIDRVEDVLQDVFLTVHQRGGYRPGVAKPRTYLATIAIQSAFNDRRRIRRDAARRVDCEADSRPSAAADPERALQSRRELDRLRLACDRLPQELRTTLLLVDIAGYSCLAAAAELQVPVGTVYSRLHAARHKLHQARSSS